MHTRVGGTARSLEAPVAVLVHGLVISSLYMVPTARRLAAYGRVLAPDLPGFGRSAKPPHTLSIEQLADALGDWLDVLRLRRVVLVGNSLGCQVIADLAARRPANILATVLAGPTMDRRARSARAQIGRWLQDWPRERPSLAAAHLLDGWRAGVRRGIATFRFALADRIEEKLPGLSAPTLVVRGDRDPIVPQPWLEEVATLAPVSDLAVIRNAPHCVNYSSADAFASLVRLFIDTVAVARPSRAVAR